MDKIYIENLKIFAYHGVNPEEKENGQNFYLTITCGIDLEPACNSDDLYDTVSYAKIIKLAMKTFTREKYDLIERAASVVAEEILDTYDRINRVRVKVSKPEAPIKAKFSDVGIEIFRER